MAETYYIGKLTGEITKLSQLENDVGFVNHLQINGVELAGNKTSEDLGLMSADASNLSSAGQKVFDGQWVPLTVTIANEISTVDRVDFDLSSYLPVDNYNYEILLYGQINITTSETEGSYRNLLVTSSLFTSNMGICAIHKTSSVKATTVGTIIIPIGSDRLLTLVARPNDVGNISLWLRGYRRIGTNQ